MNNMHKVVNSVNMNKRNNIKKLLIDEFGNMNYKDAYNSSLLHILLDYKFPENIAFEIVKVLLESSVDVNAKDNVGYNFIQMAIYTNYSAKMISELIKLGLKYNLNINSKDEDGDTILYSAIYSEEYSGDVVSLYKLLLANGYDSNIKPKDGRSIPEALKYQTTYVVPGCFSKDIIDEMTKLYKEAISMGDTKEIIKASGDEEEVETIEDPEVPAVMKQEEKTFEVSLNDRELKEIYKFGTLLNLEDYPYNIVGREAELEDLIVSLALDKKNPIIVGESGVGKTALVKSLVNGIKYYEVPTFLQEQLILQVDPNVLNAGKGIVGSLEEEIVNLVAICKKNNIILFIDEIHTIFGVGTSRANDNDFSRILKTFIDNGDIKVIGTTTKENYEEYFSNNDYKRRFEKITVKEPDNDLLYTILDQVIEDFENNTNINVVDSETKVFMIKELIKLTEKQNRNYADYINNPDLSISIIDRMFAYAKTYDKETVDIEMFIKAVKRCERVYEPSRERVVMDANKFRPVKHESKIRKFTPRGK